MLKIYFNAAKKIHINIEEEFSVKMDLALK